MAIKINLFSNSLLKPFKVIGLHKISFFLWTSFTLFGGLIGIVISIIRYVLFGDYTFTQAIYIESTIGSFYTYSIALVASVLSTVFIIFAEIEKLNFRRYQIPLITMSIFLMFFGGVCYALSKQTEYSPVGAIPQNLCLEWKQLIVFALSIVFSIYSFCVCRLDEHIEAFQSISDNVFKNAKPNLPEDVNQDTEKSNILRS